MSSEKSKFASSLCTLQANHSICRITISRFLVCWCELAGKSWMRRPISVLAACIDRKVILSFCTWIYYQKRKKCFPGSD